MRSFTGRWVGGDDFFDRESELRVLETLVRQHNHALLTGQRRMGKTSVARELGRRLAADGWIFLFADVEGASCPEDAIAEIAQAAYPIRPTRSRFVTAMGRWFTDKVEEVGAHSYRVKIRAGLNPGSWRRHGERLFRDCAALGLPVLLVLDELPIFLKRMLVADETPRRVDQFLSWMRGGLHTLGERSPVLVVSGSIGLQPLVNRLGVSDRINDLYPFRLGPWDRSTSIQCFERLAESSGLFVEPGVASAVYESLGMGIPHHIQSFFARLQEFAMRQGRNSVTTEDVREVYRTGLLGPSGQNDLIHYVTWLKEGLGDASAFSIAMEILAEAATQGVFTAGARHCLERSYSALHVDDAAGNIADVIEILEHDGYLESRDGGHRFPSHLLRDWWQARFRDHHTPLEGRSSHDSP